MLQGHEALEHFEFLAVLRVDNDQGARRGVRHAEQQRTQGAAAKCGSMQHQLLCVLYVYIYTIIYTYNYIEIGIISYNILVYIYTYIRVYIYIHIYIYLNDSEAFC